MAGKNLLSSTGKFLVNRSGKGAISGDDGGCQKCGCGPVPNLTCCTASQLPSSMTYNYSAGSSYTTRPDLSYAHIGITNTLKFNTSVGDINSGSVEVNYLPNRPSGHPYYICNKQSCGVQGRWWFGEKLITSSAPGLSDGPSGPYEWCPDPGWGKYNDTLYLRVFVYVFRTPAPVSHIMRVETVLTGRIGTLYRAGKAQKMIYQPCGFGVPSFIRGNNVSAGDCAATLPGSWTLTHSVANSQPTGSGELCGYGNNSVGWVTESSVIKTGLPTSIDIDET